MRGSLFSRCGRRGQNSLGKCEKPVDNDGEKDDNDGTQDGSKIDCAALCRYCLARLSPASFLGSCLTFSLQILEPRLKSLERTNHVLVLLHLISVCLLQRPLLLSCHLDLLRQLLSPSSLKAQLFLQLPLPTATVSHSLPRRPSHSLAWGAPRHRIEHLVVMVTLYLGRTPQIGVVPPLRALGADVEGTHELLIKQLCLGQRVEQGLWVSRHVSGLILAQLPRLDEKLVLP
mmetsp:Transcript_16580/g.41906  ORF Transcript_16580/g.41906 Transcript_16580/m.41906 type:complete len:231 (+) Transcript_16580:232-924(+)